MSKIGILSMQRIKNYGSFLQAYALKKILQEMGHDVEFVDYHIGEPIVKEDNMKNDKIKKILNILKGKESIKQKIQYLFYKKNFAKNYYKILELTKKPNYNPELDVLIIGSDEVFNCIQANKNVGYSLELFGKNNRARKTITYAASFGNTTIEKLKKYGKDKEISELLEKINAISVRDKNSGLIVEKLTNQKVEYNLDPVLIYDYMKKCELIPNIDIKEKYVIVYAYSGRISAEETNYIRKYAKKNGFKVYAIGGAQKCADKFISCTPFEVLSYFKNAELVITDTFHGSIFSIINHKNFVTLVRKSIGNAYGNEEKLIDLLERLKLKNRIIYNISELEKKVLEKISYSDVEKIINNYRNNTEKYLKENLK